MIYRTYGKTGLKVSRLGFGMRLPVYPDGNVDFNLAIARIHQARAEGINIFDTMEDYYGGQSEIALGRAMKDHRAAYVIESKLGSWPDQVSRYRQRLEASLERLQTNYIDIVLFHNLQWEYFKKFEKEIVTMATRAKDEGLIRHFGFSSHDLPVNVLQLVDTGIFESMLVQYNLIDPKWEDCIKHAHEKGLGVSVMGPVGGGRLAQPIPAIQALLPSPGLPTHRLALRYVLSNPGVDVALSGMQEESFLKENVAVASQEEPLSPQEYEQINAALEEKRGVAKLYCTGCLYCMPCPKGVQIPTIFEYLIAHKVYGVTGWARDAYAAVRGKADACVECGKCEKKCPQHIPIRERLKEASTVLGRPQAPGARPTAAAKPQPLEFVGFHKDEGSWRWMGRNGTLRLPAQALQGNAKLSFKLTCGDAKFYPVFPFKVHLSLGNKVVQEVTFTSSSQAHTVSIPLDAGAATELRLTSDSSFVPSACGLGHDHRDLSICLSECQLSAQGPADGSSHPVPTAVNRVAEPKNGCAKPARPGPVSSRPAERSRCPAQFGQRDPIRFLTDSYVQEPSNLGILEKLAVCYEKAGEAVFAEVLREKIRTREKASAARH